MDNRYAMHISAIAALPAARRRPENMRKELFLISAVQILTAGLLACNSTPTLGPSPEPEPSTPATVNMEFDFYEGAMDWEAGFAEYAPDMEDAMQLEADIRPLPSELGTEGTGYYLQGMNASDDLFMFLKHELGTLNGIIPNEEYQVKYSIVFASNAPSGAVGIGGAPGESVYLKAGASETEPQVYLDADTNHYLMNVDKGSGNSAGGPAASPIGHIANGIPAEEIDMQNPPYIYMERQHTHEYNVTSNSDGEIWLLVGTDSGFEGLTGIYYQSIAVTLEPAE